MLPQKASNKLSREKNHYIKGKYYARRIIGQIKKKSTAPATAHFAAPVDQAGIR